MLLPLRLSESLGECLQMYKTCEVLQAGNQQLIAQCLAGLKEALEPGRKLLIICLDHSRLGALQQVSQIQSGRYESFKRCMTSPHIAYVPLLLPYR